MVILDPGHGGIDGGAEANNLIEKDINLAIALNLRDFLSVQGFRVIMTREDDRSIHDQGITQISRQKRSDMYNRLAIIEDHPEAIFVSIHQNKFEQAAVCGAQVFYSQNHPDSQQLAQQIQTSFASLLQPDNTADYYVEFVFSLGELSPDGKGGYEIVNADFPTVGNLYLTEFEMQEIYQSEYSSASEGDAVKKGDKIGEASDSSYLEFKDGPHVHFEMTKDGKHISPREYLEIK